MKGLRNRQFVSRIHDLTENLLLPLQSEPVQHKDLRSQKNTGHLALVQSYSEEVQSTSPVHRRASHVEWEAGNRSIHENTEIVAQVGTSHTKSPHTGEDEDGADDEQNTTHNGLVHGCVEGLLSQSDLVHMVTQDTQREDSEGEEIASFVWATKNASQYVGVVLCSSPWLAACKSTSCCPRVEGLTNRREQRYYRGNSVSYQYNCFRERPTYFQKIGLNAMVAAETAGVSSNHMQNTEMHQGRGSSTTYQPATGLRNQQNR